MTATWSGIASPTARDWIGIYTTAAGDQSFIDWRYVSCSQTPGSAAAAGACAFPTTGLGAGNYQFRLFRDDGFTKLATSNTFTVSSGLASGRQCTRWSIVLGRRSRVPFFGPPSGSGTRE